MENTVETKIALLDQNQKQMSTEISEIKEIVKAFDEKLDKALNKKADVWVEKALSWLLYTVAGTVVVELMYLILKTKS